MVDVPVNGRVLEWARNERGLQPTAAAERLAIDESELLAYESGALMPSISLLRKMAEKYEIGFSSLLMPEPLPPTTRLEIEDFRTIRSTEAAWDPALLALIDNVNLTVEGLSDLKQEAPDLFPAMALPRASLRDNPEQLAIRERARIGIDIKNQFGWDSEYQAFRRWRTAIENQGVFVYVLKAGTQALWRGLSIFDQRGIPVAVINSGEADTEPRIFTLLHEYCHLLLRQTAISDENRKHAAERFCNQFAAYFLMPRAPFLAEAVERAPAQGEEWSDKAIKSLGARFKMSMSAIAIHLEDLGLAPSGLYERKLVEWKDRKKKKSKAVVEYPAKLANRLGIRHVETVMSALDRGYIDQLDANELMFDTKPEYFKPLRQVVEERKAVYGWGQRK